MSGECLHESVIVTEVAIYCADCGEPLNPHTARHMPDDRNTMGVL